MSAYDPKRTLAGGHNSHPTLSQRRFEPLRCPVLSLGGNENVSGCCLEKAGQFVLGRQDQRKIMIIRMSTVLSVASLIAAFAGARGAAGEWATKEEAIAMVKEAMVFITQHGPAVAYAEITNKAGRFHDRDHDVVVCGGVYRF
jgi:hypothetical protein